MKIASIGDIHAGQNNIQETKNGMYEAGKVWDDLAIEVLLITGDLFHEFNIGGKNESFGTVFYSVLSPLNDFIANNPKRKIIILPGNHDMPTEKESLDALTSFDFRDRIFVARGIHAYKIAPNIMVTTLPWMYPSMYSTKQNLLDSLKEIRDNSKGYTNILAGHCEIDGSEIISGHTMFGGHFNFTYDEINQLGFDAVTLGHVHKTQGFYTGIPWQQNFGDEKATGRIRVFEIGETINSDELIEIPNTAKYYNITTDDVKTFKKNLIDHVKVVGSKLTMDLPDGFKFEKEKTQTDIKPRTNVSCNDDISVLLEKWLKEKKYKHTPEFITKLIEILNKIAVSTAYGTKFGSLDRFESVKIEGIGSHKNTSMTFVEPIVAISGGNGVGKTIFLESLFAGLYGELPSYGKLANLSDKSASLDIVFHTNHARYKVTRFIKSGKNTAYVYKGRNPKPVVGPKVSEVNAFITKIVGPKELLLSSVFSTQVHAGDIVELESSKRKDIFHKLLGLEVFAEMQDKVNDKFKEAKTQREMLTSQLKVVKSLNTLEDEVVDISNKMVLSQKALTNHRCRVVDYTAKLHKADFELHVLDVRLIDKTNAEKDLKDNRNALVITNKKLDKFELIDIDEIVADIKTKQAEFVLMEQGYHKQANEFKGLEGLTDVYNDKIYQHGVLKLSTEHVCNIHNTKVAELVDKTDLMDDIGCKENPLPCPYIDGAIQAESKLDTLLCDHAETMVEWNNKSAKCQKEIDKAKHDKDKFQANMVEYDKEAYETLKNKIGVLHHELEDSENHNLKKEGLLSDKVYYLDEISKCKAILLDMKDNISAKHIIVTNQITGYKGSLVKEQALATKQEVSIAEYKKDLEHLQEDLEKLTKLGAQLMALDLEIPRLDILNEALSKNGIPQLIIDSALPQLQDILDILCGAINKFNIEIKTQKPNKDGTNAKETIDFIVDDGIKARDVKFFSGGEKKLLKTLIRLSLSLFQSQRTGNSYKLLLMDETFDALDFENSMMLLKIIYNLRTKFKQIFVISHSDDVLGRLSKCIKFKREGNRTIING